MWARWAEASDFVEFFDTTQSLADSLDLIGIHQDYLIFNHVGQNDIILYWRNNKYEEPLYTYPEYNFRGNVGSISYRAPNYYAVVEEYITSESGTKSLYIVWKNGVRLPGEPYPCGGGGDFGEPAWDWCFDDPDINRYARPTTYNYYPHAGPGYGFGRLRNDGYGIGSLGSQFQPGGPLAAKSFGISNWDCHCTGLPCEGGTDSVEITEVSGYKGFYTDTEIVIKHQAINSLTTGLTKTKIHAAGYRTTGGHIATKIRYEVDNQGNTIETTLCWPEINAFGACPQCGWYCPDYCEKCATNQYCPNNRACLNCNKTVSVSSHIACLDGEEPFLDEQPDPTSVSGNQFITSDIERKVYKESNGDIWGIAYWFSKPLDWTKDVSVTSCEVPASTLISGWKKCPSTGASDPNCIQPAGHVFIGSYCVVGLGYWCGNDAWTPSSSFFTFTTPPIDRPAGGSGSLPSATHSVTSIYPNYLFKLRVELTSGLTTDFDLETSFPNLRHTCIDNPYYNPNNNVYYFGSCWQTSRDCNLAGGNSAPYACSNIGWLSSGYWCYETPIAQWIHSSWGAGDELKEYIAILVPKTIVDSGKLYFGGGNPNGTSIRIREKAANCYEAISDYGDLGGCVGCDTNPNPGDQGDPGMPGQVYYGVGECGNVWYPCPNPNDPPPTNPFPPPCCNDPKPLGSTIPGYISYDIHVYKITRATVEEVIIIEGLRKADNFGFIGRYGIDAGLWITYTEIEYQDHACAWTHKRKPCTVIHVDGDTTPRPEYIKLDGTKVCNFGGKYCDLANLYWEYTTARLEPAGIIFNIKTGSEPSLSCCKWYYAAHYEKSDSTKGSYLYWREYELDTDKQFRVGCCNEWFGNIGIEEFPTGEITSTTFGKDVYYAGKTIIYNRNYSYFTGTDDGTYYHQYHDEFDEVFWLCCGNFGVLKKMKRFPFRTDHCGNKHERTLRVRPGDESIVRERLENGDDLDVIESELEKPEVPEGENEKDHITWVEIYKDKITDDWIVIDHKNDDVCKIPLDAAYDYKKSEGHVYRVDDDGTATYLNINDSRIEKIECCETPYYNVHGEYVKPDWIWATFLVDPDFPKQAKLEKETGEEELKNTEYEELYYPNPWPRLPEEYQNPPEFSESYIRHRFPGRGVYIWSQNGTLHSQNHGKDDIIPCWFNDDGFKHLRGKFLYWGDMHAVPRYDFHWTHEAGTNPRWYGPVPFTCANGRFMFNANGVYHIFDKSYGRLDDLSAVTLKPPITPTGTLAFQ
jgi:hypothetical protein